MSIKITPNVSGLCEEWIFSARLPSTRTKAEQRTTDY